MNGETLRDQNCLKSGKMNGEIADGRPPTRDESKMEEYYSSRYLHVSEFILTFK